jgi:hypothetical protein
VLLLLELTPGPAGQRGVLVQQQVRVWVLAVVLAVGAPPLLGPWGQLALREPRQLLPSWVRVPARIRRMKALASRRDSNELQHKEGMCRMFNSVHAACM